ncbi:MAG: hypothetical protein LBJ84_05400 [Oscillospiraceae bacterium]|jgi:hypothetical protein|nr:hypothetical protein [Oscillospiraceae bacterium]
MAKTAKDFIAWLETEAAARVTESPAGSNRVKYWDMVYPSFQGQPWCLGFIIAGARAVGFGKDAAPDIYSCTELRAWAQKRGAWVAAKDICPGDVVLFDFDGKPDRLEHVGGCISVNAAAKTAVCIEGNTAYDERSSQANGGCVARKTRALSLIAGAYRPPYKIEGDDDMTDAQFDKHMEGWMARQDKLGVSDRLAPEEYADAVRAGVSDGTRPQAPATRQEVTVIAYRAARQTGG